MEGPPGPSPAPVPGPNAEMTPGPRIGAEGAEKKEVKDWRKGERTRRSSDSDPELSMPAGTQYDVLYRSDIGRRDIG